jgi:hypothetical protein
MSESCPEHTVSISHTRQHKRESPIILAESGGSSVESANHASIKDWNSQSNISDRSAYLQANEQNESPVSTMNTGDPMAAMFLQRESLTEVEDSLSPPPLRIVKNYYSAPHSTAHTSIPPPQNVLARRSSFETGQPVNSKDYEVVTLTNSVHGGPSIAHNSKPEISKLPTLPASRYIHSKRIKKRVSAADLVNDVPNQYSVARKLSNAFSDASGEITIRYFPSVWKKRRG